MHRLVAFWVSLRSTLWFVPANIVFCAVVLALVLAQLGRIYPGFAQPSLPGIFGFSADGSRAMLSSIATSMITVAGVAFSITIVALSLASTQYSPRVLRHFMRDRGNQAVLGIFVGIFAYCLVVLPLIRGGEEDGYVPALAVAFAVILAIVGVAALIYFIHHVATSIQASAIVAAIAAETHKAVSELFPETVGHDAEVPAELRDLDWHVIVSPVTGMLQMVDEAALLDIAHGQQLVLRMERPIGDFVVAGTPLVSTSRVGEDNRNFEAKVTSAFILNRTRTIEQDAAYGVRQIVDVALRALSPSLNDTTTAILCINHLADVLRHLAARHLASPYRRHEGTVRVIAKRPEFEHFIQLAFDQIRESGCANTVVLERLLWAVETIGDAARKPSRRQVLAEAARAIGTVAEREIKDPAARRELAQRAGALMALYRAGGT